MVFLSYNSTFRNAKAIPSFSIIDNKLLFTYYFLSFTLSYFVLFILGISEKFQEQRVALQLFARRCAQALACIIHLRIGRIHSGAFLYHRKAISYDIKKPWQKSTASNHNKLNKNHRGLHEIFR